MYGVPLQNVQLFDYRGLLLGSATDYQANKQDHLSWTEFKNRGQVQLAAHKVTNPKKVYV